MLKKYNAERPPHATARRRNENLNKENQGHGKIANPKKIF
jgi:hypothetical protein